MKVKTKYQESFDKLYSKGDILKKSIITLLIILFLDYLNIFTKLFEIKGLIPIYLIASLFLIIKIIEFKPWNLYKLETVNYVDSFFYDGLIDFDCINDDLYLLGNNELIAFDINKEKILYYSFEASNSIGFKIKNDILYILNKKSLISFKIL